MYKHFRIHGLVHNSKFIVVILPYICFLVAFYWQNTLHTLIFYLPVTIRQTKIHIDSSITCFGEGQDEVRQNVFT